MSHALSLAAALERLDKEALRHQKLALRFLTASLVCGALAGFVALAGQPWLILACLLALGAMAGNLIATRKKWRRRWHSTRTLHELLLSERWRFAARVTPYEDDDAPAGFQDRLDTLTAETGHTARIDEETRALRQQEPNTLLKTYLRERIEDQKDYFTNRSRLYFRRARWLRRLVSLLYVVVGGVAVAEVAGVFDQHALGPTVAVVTSLQVWAGAREWGRTARVYSGYARQLEDLATEARQLGDNAVSELRGIVARTENILADETTRWLALNDFELFDKHYGTHTG
ncbi:uncharacterized protein DUF4231 [Bogoriella caseilytica]|uniref:Uncharacterized protein DUF4231 n=2 Tax=Bogoriella caseilytica TaxID=56055 RepID=A0A3N2BH70_9MICO|nr:uncharacterized protein DUF4231 [Bogoriella caseilytica]